MTTNPGSTSDSPTAKITGGRTLTSRDIARSFANTPPPSDFNPDTAVAGDARLDRATRAASMNDGLDRAALDSYASASLSSRFSPHADLPDDAHS